VAATGYNEAYYREYLGNPQELVSAVKWSYLYQGQRYFWQGKPRGTPTRGIRRHRFVHYLQNHDQVANSASGKRLHHFTSPGRYRAISALLLLSPQTPLIFQGQEFAASSRFLYFSDLAPQLAEKVRKGRVEFLRQFGNIDTPEIAEALDRPDDPATFERCVLDHGERESNGETYRLYGDLMKLRRQDPVFRELDANEVDGAVLGPEAFLIRYAGREGERLLLFNLGRDLRMHPAPEPLLAPPLHREWRILWSSESPRYGGSGTPTLETGEEWLVPGHAAVVLEPGPATGN
jgi:maltooligosyltrehalose trehalohydrolase